MDNAARDKAMALMSERFGQDTLLSLATLKDGRPSVRIVDGYYEDGSFYVVTYALSNKMKHIATNPNVAVCAEWFSASGTGEDAGWILDVDNGTLSDKLREVFAAWYTNGDVDESDENTRILRIRLDRGVLMSHGTRYEIDFRTQSK